MKQINTSDFLAAIREYAAEHGTEDAYQAATQLFKQRIITQDQWSDTVHALYDNESSTPA